MKKCTKYGHLRYPSEKAHLTPQISDIGCQYLDTIFMHFCFPFNIYLILYSTFPYIFILHLFPDIPPLFFLLAFPPK